MSWLIVGVLNPPLVIPVDVDGCSTSVAYATDDDVSVCCAEGCCCCCSGLDSLKTDRHRSGGVLKEKRTNKTNI